MVKVNVYPLLNNIKLLYFIFILAIINIGGFVYIKDNQSIFLFACIAIIIYFFNPNMIIVLLSTMIIVNMLIFLNKLNGSTEGYENEEEDDDEDEKKEEMIVRESLENEYTINDSSKNELPKMDMLKNEVPKNEIGKLTDINDETDTNSIKDKIKKIIPDLKDSYDNINNLNAQINKLTSILE